MCPIKFGGGGLRQSGIGRSGLNGRTRFTSEDARKIRYKGIEIMVWGLHQYMQVCFSGSVKVGTTAFIGWCCCPRRVTAGYAKD